MECRSEAPDYISRSFTWNPWHGCHKVSEGCRNCYMFTGNENRGITDSDTVKRSVTNFDAPLKKDRNGHWAVDNVLVLTSMTSDFFIEEADPWRDEAWDIIRRRKDIPFEILTKRPERIPDCLPDDWGSGYGNVRLSVSAEDQRTWDRRVPALLEIPAHRHDVFIAPIIGPVDTDPLLSDGGIDCIYLGGEYGGRPRPCDYSWVTDIRGSCIRNRVSFFWRNTGAVLMISGIPVRFGSISEQGRYCMKKDLDVVFDDPVPEIKQRTLFRRSQSSSSVMPFTSSLRFFPVLLPM